MHLNNTRPTGLADCLTARRTLELVIPGQNDSKVEQAREHVQACATCQRTIALHEKIDLRLSEVCRDVEVPTGLKERLQSALQIDSATVKESPQTAAIPVGSAKATATESRRWGRRAWLRAVGVTAASLTFAVGGWVWYAATGPSVNLDELCRQVLDVLPGAGGLPPFTSFSDGSAPQSPATMNGLSLASPPKLVSFGGKSTAVYQVALRAHEGHPAANGFLIVVPVANVIDLPAATSFLGGGPNYRYPGHCATAWVEGNFVYVCCVKGVEANLKSLVPSQANFT